MVFEICYSFVICALVFVINVFIHFVIAFADSGCLTTRISAPACSIATDVAISQFTPCAMESFASLTFHTSWPTNNMNGIYSILSPIKAASRALSMIE